MKILKIWYIYEFVGELRFFVFQASCPCPRHWSTSRYRSYNLRPLQSSSEISVDLFSESALLSNWRVHPDRVYGLSTKLRGWEPEFRTIDGAKGRQTYICWITGDWSTEDWKAFNERRSNKQKRRGIRNLVKSNSSFTSCFGNDIDLPKPINWLYY